MTPDDAVAILNGEARRIAMYLGDPVARLLFDNEALERMPRVDGAYRVLLAECKRLAAWEKAGQQFQAERDELRKTLEHVSAERERLREAVEMIAGQRPCLDNLMSNVDIARSALAGKAQP